MVDLIADSPLLRRLERLELRFCDDDRELPRLVERAADLQHLSELTFWCYPMDDVTLRHPTRDTLAAPLARRRAALKQD